VEVPPEVLPEEPPDEDEAVFEELPPEPVPPPAVPPRYVPGVPLPVAEAAPRPAEGRAPAVAALWFDAVPVRPANVPLTPESPRAGGQKRLIGELFEQPDAPDGQTSRPDETAPPPAPPRRAAPLPPLFDL
jgi:hypothetical protein